MLFILTKKKAWKLQSLHLQGLRRDLLWCLEISNRFFLDKNREWLSSRFDLPRHLFVRQAAGVEHKSHPRPLQQPAQVQGSGQDVAEDLRATSLEEPEGDQLSGEGKRTRSVRASVPSPGFRRIQRAANTTLAKTVQRAQRPPLRF